MDRRGLCAGLADAEEQVSKPVGPYTPAMRAGDWLVVSGQVGIRDGQLVSGGMQAELRQALAKPEGPARE